jgi:hypothetical protein
MRLTAFRRIGEWRNGEWLMTKGGNPFATPHSPFASTQLSFEQSRGVIFFSAA